MKASSQEWIEKAEADWRTARREFTADEPNFDAVCFHAQQCVKKYLHARMDEAEIPAPLTHHLGVLLALCVDAEPSWDQFREQARTLTANTIQLQHPGPCAPEDQAQASLDAAGPIRVAARKSFGLGD
ncbi:MAG TPA: HEPN domain-containing protein [Holophagaceae bacterium]|nr:HEPN domain-containing protein [Holophagaceae bacterium]